MRALLDTIGLPGTMAGRAARGLAVALCLCAHAGAASANQAHCTELKQTLAEKGQNPEERVVNVTLFAAAEKGCVEIAKALFSSGASAAVRRRGGQSALHVAAEAGEVEMVALLLDHGAAIDLRDLKGAHALFLAAEARRKDVVKLLVDRRASVNLPGRSGTSALAAAAFAGNAAIVKMLLAAGADPNLADISGKTPVLYAAGRGFQPIFETLLASGVAVDAKHAHDLTVLMWAAGHANDVPEDEGLALVQFLLDRGARIEERDDRGRTALMIAAELGRTAIVAELLKRGAARDAKYKDGKAAADLAANDAIKVALAGP
jgi:ankyrin repeat protein